MMVLVSLFLAILGFIFGIIIFIFIYLALGFRFTSKNHCHKINPYYSNNLKSDKNLSLIWLNRLLWRAYPRFISRKALESKLIQIFSEIPNGVQAIQKMELNNFKFHSMPPSMRTIQMVEDGFTFQIDYEPNLIIDATTEVQIPYISPVSLQVQFELHQFQGDFQILITKDGIIQMSCLDSTHLNFDIKTSIVSTISIGKELLESVWNKLKQWVNAYIHQVIVYFVIEDIINFIYESSSSGFGKLVHVSMKNRGKKFTI